MKQFSRRSILSLAALPALAISAWAYSTTNKETPARPLEERDAHSSLNEIRIKPSIAAPNGLRWFRL
jgi:hypothetical protein